MTFRRARFLVPTALLAGVAVTSSCMEEREVGTVAVARTALLGMSDVDIRMCAGFPSKTADIDQGQIWSYERNINRGGLNIGLPTFNLGAIPALGGGSVNVAPGGNCNTQIRFSKGRVVDVAYAGDNDLPRRRNALCTSIVDECVDYSRRRHSAQPQR